MNAQRCIRCDAAIEELQRVTKERDEARYNARILAHAYEHDSRPPPKVVDDSLAYPVDSRVIVEGGHRG